MATPGLRRWPLLIALLVVYLVWGSTYLGIAIAVSGIPPLASAGVRHLLAGLALLIAMRCWGQPWPAARTWIGAAVMGVLMLVLGNGLVCVAEREVPSGLTALLLAITPIFVVLGTWWRDGRRPGPLAVLGMALGLTGVAVLCAPGTFAAPWWAYACILIASITWAAGVVLSPRLPQSDHLLMRAGMQMVCGGALLLLIATVLGERLPSWSAAPQSWLAVLYLAVFGSIIAYSAYLWLQQHASPALATSNAYVNPLVALALGAALHGEALGARIGMGGALVIAAVVVIALGQRPKT